MPGDGYGMRPVESTLGPDDSSVVLNYGGLKILAFKVNHGEIEPAVGCRFEYGGRSVVVSGDTALSENLIKFARDADIPAICAPGHEAISTCASSSGPASPAQVSAKKFGVPLKTKDARLTIEYLVPSGRINAVWPRPAILVNQKRPAPDFALGSFYPSGGRACASS